MTTQFRSPFTVRRKVAGSYVNGFWVEGSESSFVIQASVQPVRGLELESLPEARRDSQAVKIYTDTQLLTVAPDGSTNPDILEAFGFDFEIIEVQPWQSNVISHYKCIGVKL
jgi:hypothetical protein